MSSEDSTIERDIEPFASYHSSLIKVETDHDETGMEIGSSIRFLDHCLDISFCLSEEDIEPLFSGASWAGTTVWPASILLSDFILENAVRVQSSSMIELGAGLGIPGFVAAKLGATVVMTEQEKLLGLLSENVGRNFSDISEEVRRPIVQELFWSKENTQCLLEGSNESSRILSEASDAESPLEANFMFFDVILASDVVYEPLYGDSWRLLISVLEVLLQCFPDGKGNYCLISIERRDQDGVEDFFLELERKGFQKRQLKSESRGRLLLYFIAKQQVDIDLILSELQ